MAQQELGTAEAAVGRMSKWFDQWARSSKRRKLAIPRISPDAAIVGRVRLLTRPPPDAPHKGGVWRVPSPTVEAT